MHAWVWLAVTCTYIAQEAEQRGGDDEGKEEGEHDDVPLEDGAVALFVH